MLKELQHDVDTWIQASEEGYWQPLEMFTKLAEECGEVGKEINRFYGPNVLRIHASEEKLGEELSDVLFAVGCIANQSGIDLDEAWHRGMVKRNSRSQK